MAVTLQGEDYPRIIKLPHDADHIETAVAYDKDQETLRFGEDATRLLRKSPAIRKLWPIKRFLGGDKYGELGPHERVSPQEHAAYLISLLLITAEEQTGSTLEAILGAPCVVTFPVNAESDMRAAIREALELAGFENIQGMEEPYAAVYSYLWLAEYQTKLRFTSQLNQLIAERDELEAKNRTTLSDVEKDELAKEKKRLTDRIQEVREERDDALATFYENHDGRHILVYDFGGGTFDTVVARIGSWEGGVPKVKVIAKGGRDIGGDSLTRELAHAILENHLERETDLDLSEEEKRAARSLLYEKAEQAKIKMSDTRDTIDIDYGSCLKDAKLPTYQSWNSLQLKQLYSKFLDSTIETCKDTLDSAGLTPDDLHKIYLVGGSSKFWFIRPRLNEEFAGRRGDIVQDLRNIFMASQDTIQSDDANAGFGLGGWGRTSGREERLAIDPMQAVAKGAALAARESGRSKSFLSDLGFSNVSSLSIWWNEGRGKEMKFHRILDKDSPLPGKYTKALVADNPNRGKVRFSIWESELSQEELELQEFNRAYLDRVGRIEFDLSKSAPDAKIGMDIEVDESGRLNLVAEQAGESSYVDSMNVSGEFRPRGVLSKFQKRLAEERVAAFVDGNHRAWHNPLEKAPVNEPSEEEAQECLVFIDGANVARANGPYKKKRGKYGTIRHVDLVVEELQRLGLRPMVVTDSSLLHDPTLKDDEYRRKYGVYPHSIVNGAEADTFILSEAQKHENVLIVTKDNYYDHRHLYDSIPWKETLVRFDFLADGVQLVTDNKPLGVFLRENGCLGSG